jgi:hypothetical protein
MLRYSFWSTCSPSSSASRAVVVLIIAVIALEYYILNFRTMSLVYLAWCTNVPSFDYLICIPRKNCNSPIMLILNSLLIIVWTSVGPLPRWLPDRLLGGPLGLPDLRCTTPAGVEHKDYRGVLG